MPILIPPPDETAPAPQPGGLGERLVNGIQFVFQATVGSVANLIASIIGRGLEMLIESLEDGLELVIDNFLGRTDLSAETRAEIKASLFPRSSPALPAVILAALAAIAGIIAGWFSGIGQAAVKRLTAQVLYRVNRETPTFRISAEDGVMAERRGALSIDDIESDLADLGVDPRRAAALIARSYRWLTTPMIEEMVYRGLITKPQALELLKGIGIPDYQADLTLQTFDRLVSASDLQRFGIREVFTEALAAPLKFPEPGPRYYQEMAKLGFSTERAEWFWMAHWRLPSLTQGYEMFRRLGPHRGRAISFSEDDLRELMRRDDMLSKYWDGLIAVQWRPLNRLDIWRLATSGLIPRDEAAEHYMDYGYHPDLARRMAELASEDKTAESRLLSQSLVQDAYKRRVISRDDAYNALVGMRFRAEDANLVLTISDLQKQSERAGERTSIIRQRFLTGLISDSEATGQLANLGKPAEEIGDLIELWQSQRADKVETPPVGTLETWYKRRIISGPAAQDELRRRGYEDRYVANYLLEWDQELQEAEERLSADELRQRQAQLKVPTRADLATWAKAGLITIDDFSRRLADQGYSATDVANYARLVGLQAAPPEYTTEAGKVRVATLRELVRRDVITIDEHEAGLVNLGMSPDLARSIATYELARTL